MADRTIFHDILEKKIPADIVYEDDEILVFKDINPKAPTHLLFVPKEYAPGIRELTEETEHLPGLLVNKARKFAAEKGIDGYKLTFHCGPEGGQLVFYIHLHFLSQQKLS